MKHFQQHHNGYVISTDPKRLDLGIIHQWISTESYWASGRSRQTVETSVEASLNFGAYTNPGEMVGAARVVTDFATFGWLCDLFVLDAHRGHGLGKALVSAVVEHPDLAGLQRMILVTADAHELYSRYGFELMASPERWMERNRPVS